MKNFVVSIFLLSFTTISIFSQSTSNPIDVGELVQRVDSLEHELSYQKLTSEINSLNSEIQIFTNSVECYSNTIKINLYTSNFDSELATSYKNFYEVCVSKRQAIADLIETREIYLTALMTKKSFSIDELSYLMRIYRIQKQGYNTLDGAVNLLKLIIDEYARHI